MGLLSTEGLCRTKAQFSELMSQQEGPFFTLHQVTCHHTILAHMVKNLSQDAGDPQLNLKCGGKEEPAPPPTMLTGGPHPVPSGGQEVVVHLVGAHVTMHEDHSSSPHST